jgi:hypothetical protein
MTKIQLTDVEKFKEDNSLCILVFGDTTSILTKSLFNLMSGLGCEVRLLDTEEDLLSYSTFRIRTTPMVHVYKDSEILGVFTLPIDIEGVKRCLV